LIEKNILIALVSEDDLIKKWLAKARCSQEIVCSSNEEDARELLEK
jgi:hypothetical protein